MERAFRSLPFTATISSDLAAWARFGIGALQHFKRLLLLYVLVFPNSSKLVAALYLEPMKIIWRSRTPFTVETSLNWLPGPDLAPRTLTLFKVRLLLLHVLVLPNSSKLVAASYMEPKLSL